MKSLINKNGTISKKRNKYYSFEVSLDSHYPGFFNGHLKLFIDDFIVSGKLFLMNIFNLFIMWNKHSDHAGFTFSVSLIGLNIYFNIYDSRHWDYENNKWCEYDYDE